MVRRVLILADESAHWRIAGLRQLDRLALALNELAAARAESLELSILWPPDFSPERKFVPQNPRLSRVEFAATPPHSVDLVLSTRLFLSRNSSTLASRLTAGAKEFDEPREFFRQVADVRAAWRDPGAAADWEYLEDAAQIAACEKRFLRASGKSQDGLVSRFINRPISRAISRVLLRTPVTPSAWTLAIFVLPLIGSAWLARGGYASVIAGLAFFQIYSILDGCDGEIARAKYLDSPRGRQLDTFCDTLGNLLMILGLGWGLSRQTPPSTFYFIESIIVAILIVTNEFLLALPSTPPSVTDSALYPRHQRLIESSGLLFFGKRFSKWLIQLTKRDVAILGFLALGLAGQPAWILHLSGAVAAISSLLALKSFLR